MIKLLITLSLLTSCIKNPLYLIQHEDGHYNAASRYGLNPRIDYTKNQVRRYHNSTTRQDLDIIGAGITWEQRLKRQLADYRIPNDPSTIYTLYRFNGRSDDGQDYLSLMPDETHDLRRAVIIEPLIMLGQIGLNLVGSDWFVTSQIEVDRRGVYSLYEVCFRGRF